MSALTPIAEIVADPQYAAFAAACIARGRQVVPGGFPWNAMGLSDAELRARSWRFESGREVPAEHVESLIHVVRAQEKLVAEWWRGWGGWHWLEARHPSDRPAAPGMLF